jgi:hypothetical protein
MSRIKLIGLITIVGLSCEVLAVDSVQARLNQLEQEMNQVLSENSVGTIGAVFSRRDNIALGSGWAVDIEPLLWHVKSGGADWALSLDQGYYPISGSMKTLGFGWDWGVRVGVTKYCASDWAVDLLYTYFRSADTSKAAVNFQASGVLGDSSATYSGKLSYNALDFTLGKAIFVSSRVALKPHIGLKNTWINQRYTLKDLNFIDLGTLSGNVNMQVTDKDRVWGIGPEAGWDLGLYCTKSLSFVAVFEGALLQGYFNVSENEVLDSLPVGAAATQSVTNLKGNMHQFIPYGRMLLGGNWGRVLNEGKQRIDLSLNYEINYFWKINQTLNQATSVESVDGASRRVLINRFAEDLAFYGVTFKVNLGF